MIFSDRVSKKAAHKVGSSHIRLLKMLDTLFDMGGIENCASEIREAD